MEVRMRKKVYQIIFLILIVFFTGFSNAIAFNKEYASIVGEVKSINLQNSSITIDILSTTCEGIQTINISNKEFLQHIKVGQIIPLSVTDNCNNYLIKGEEK